MLPGVNFSYHCVGHSLGSHSCGFAGQSMARLGLRMSRISALDPAGPLFLKQTLRGGVSQDTVSARQGDTSQYFVTALGIGTLIL